MSFLWGHQGYEYVDLGPRLADPAVRRTADLAVPGGAGDASRRSRVAGEQRQSALALPAVRRRHRPVLRRRPDLGPAHAPVDRRVLALVGGPPVGGRLLRGLRHHRDRLLLHAPGPDPAGASPPRPRCSRPPSSSSGGIIGTCHHLYFSGTPTVALAWGSVFSALEVVPLVLVAYSALDDLRRGRLAPWVQRYRGRSTSSSPWPSGTWWAPDCSAS